jgi:hypothetical protein
VLGVWQLEEARRQQLAAKEEMETELHAYQRFSKVEVEALQGKLRDVNTQLEESQARGMALQRRLEEQAAQTEQQLRARTRQLAMIPAYPSHAQ